MLHMGDMILPIFPWRRLG